MQNNFDSALVEHATLSLASRAGITTVETRLLRLKDRHALLVRRFDRGKGAHRIDCISAGTAIRASHTVAGSSAELGYPALAHALMRNGVTANLQHQQEARELFRRMVFNILVGNTEDHEKTHSLLVEFENAHGHLKLAPAYALKPACSYKTTQSFACGLSGQDATLLNAMSNCAAFGLLEAEAAWEISSLAALVDTWKLHFAAVGVSNADIAVIACHLDSTRLHQARADFQQRYPMAIRHERPCAPF